MVDKIYCKGIGWCTGEPVDLDVVEWVDSKDVCLTAAIAHAATIPHKSIRRGLHRRADRSARTGQEVVISSQDTNLDAAPYGLDYAYWPRQEVRESLWQAVPPCSVRSYAIIIIIRKIHTGAVDAHRAVLNGDLEHLHGAAVAEEQLRWALHLPVPAGEVESRGVVAAGLHAERVRDAGVAADPCSISAPRTAEPREHQQRCKQRSERYDSRSSNLLHECVCKI